MAKECKRRRLTQGASAQSLSVRVCGLGGQQVEMSMPDTKTILDVKRSVDKKLQIPLLCQKLVNGADIVFDADQLSQLRSEADSESPLEVTLALVLDVSGVLQQLGHVKAAQRKAALSALQKLGKRCGGKAKSEIICYLEEAYLEDGTRYYSRWGGYGSRGTRCAGIRALAKMVDKGDSEAIRVIAYMCLCNDVWYDSRYDTCEDDERPRSEQVRSVALHELLSIANVGDPTVLAAMAFCIKRSKCHKVIQLVETNIWDFLPDMDSSCVRTDESDSFRRLVLKCIRGDNPLERFERASNMDAATKEAFAIAIIAAIRGWYILQDVAALYGGQDELETNPKLMPSLMIAFHTLAANQHTSSIIRALRSLREDDWCLRCALERAFDCTLDNREMLKYFEDSATCIRIAAVHALAPCMLVGDVEISKAVTECLSDPSADVRKAAEFLFILARHQ